MNKKYIAPSIRITEVALQSLIAASLGGHDEEGGGQLGKESDVMSDDWGSADEEEQEASPLPHPSLHSPPRSLPPEGKGEQQRKSGRT